MLKESFYNCIFKHKIGSNSVLLERMLSVGRTLFQLKKVLNLSSDWSIGILFHSRLVKNISDQSNRIK